MVSYPFIDMSCMMSNPAAQEPRRRLDDLEFGILSIGDGGGSVEIGIDLGGESGAGATLMIEDVPRVIEWLKRWMNEQVGDTAE